jgi:hypothetical protein
MLYFVNVSLFGQGTKLDKNGLSSVYLTSIHGAPIPERARVMSGTLAERAGLQLHHSYLMKIDESGSNEYGTNYTYLVLNELSVADIISFARTNVAAPAAPKPVSTTDSDSQLP